MRNVLQSIVRLGNIKREQWREVLRWDVCSNSPLMFTTGVFFVDSYIPGFWTAVSV